MKRQYTIGLLLLIIIFTLTITSMSQDLMKQTKAEISKNAPNLKDIKYTYVGTWETETSGHQTGNIINDKKASKGKAILAKIEESSSSYMQYGQYISLEPGNYVAFIRAKSGKALSNNAILQIDATANSADIKIAEIYVGKNDFNSDKYTAIPLFFTITDANKNRVEIRVHWKSTANTTVDKVDIYKINKILENPAFQVRKVPQIQPTGNPNNLDYKTTNFPTKDIFPISKPISENITVFDVTKVDADWRLALTALQGLINRDKPQLYLIYNSEDTRWLNYMKKQGYIKSAIIESNPQKIIKKYSKYIKGTVITDPYLPDSINVATMYAAVYDLIPCSNRLSKMLKLNVKLDTRGKWKNTAQAYNWAFDNLWSKQNHYVASCLWNQAIESRDYLVQHKIFIFWVPGPIDSANSYSAPLEEMKFVEKLLSKLPPNTPIMGYSWAGVDIGIGEGGGVGLFATFGHYLVGSVNVPNLSVHSGVRIKTDFKQTAKATYPKLNKTKKYVAFTMSDGDNIPVLTGFNWPQLWNSPIRGKFPMTWTISPASCVLIPDVMEYYYSTATQNDSFGAAVSGVGYTYPALYGNRFKNKKQVFDGFMDLTEEYMKRMDLNVLFPMNVTKKEIGYFADRLDFIKGEFPDYSRNVNTYDESLYLSDNNIPVIHSGTTWDPNNTEPKYMAKRMADEIKSWVPTNNEPAFIHAFLWNWGFNLEIINDVINQLGDDYVILSAEDLAYVAKEYLEEEKITVSYPKVIGNIKSEPVSLEITLQNLMKQTNTVNIEPISGLDFNKTSVQLQYGKPYTLKLNGIPTSDTINIKYSGSFGERNINISVASLSREQLPDELKSAQFSHVKQFEAENMKGTTGSIIDDSKAIGKQARAIGENDKLGHIVYGPYYNLDKGNYIAVFRIRKLDDNKKMKVILDIAPAGASAIKELDLTSSMLTKEYTNIIIPFTFQNANVETRVLWENGAKIAVDSIGIYKINK